MKGLGILFLLTVGFVAGLFAGLYLAGYTSEDLGTLLEDKLQSIVSELPTPTPATKVPTPTEPSRPPTPTPGPRTAAPTAPLAIVEVYNTAPVGLRVRSTPVIEEGNILGKVFDGTRFLVVGEPETGSGYEWLKVRLEGWAATNWLSGAPAVGTSVVVKATGDLGLRVRDEPSLDANVLGKVYDGTRLQVLNGPVSSSGFQWWKVRLEGWAASEYLREPVDQSVVPPEPATGEAKLSADELNKRIKTWQRHLESHVQEKTRMITEGALPASKGLGFTLVRMLAPNIIERSDQFFLLSQDYDLLAIKSLGFARKFLKQGDSALSAEYLERSYRYLKLSHMMEQGSIEQLLAATDISQDLVAIMSSMAILSVAAEAFGPPGHVAYDIFSAYVDYSIDTAVKEIPVERAIRRELTGLVVKQLFRTPAVKEAIGEPITKFIGRESGLYQRLEQVMLTPEVREEIMRTVATSAETLGKEAAEVDATWLANEVVGRLEETIAAKASAQ